MWFWKSNRQQSTSRRRMPAPWSLDGGLFENLETRALLSAVSGIGGASESNSQVVATELKAGVPKIQIIPGTYNIHSSTGNTGTYAFQQKTPLVVSLTAATTNYTGAFDLQFHSERSKVAKGDGQFQFTGEQSPQEVRMKIKFKIVDGELDFKYRYRRLNPA